MMNEEKIEKLASIIYSQCGVTIRNDESHAIAKKLVELEYEKKSETAKEFTELIEREISAFDSDKDFNYGLKVAISKINSTKE